MSPLVLSLLALTTLLAAADAQTGACGFATIGQEGPLSTKPVEIKIFGEGILGPCPNICQLTHVGQRVGEIMVACNNDPKGGVPPFVQPAHRNDLRTTVNITCPDGCSYGVNVFIVQYCA